MGFQVTQLPFEEALNTVADYPFALVYNISSLQLCRTAGKTFDLSQAQEARFFGPDKELHLLFDEKKALLVQDNDKEDIIRMEYRLADKYSSVGKTLSVKRYLKTDEDGQTYVALTRLAGIN